MLCAGRRSLLVHFPDERSQDLCIASVSCPSATMLDPETLSDACNGLVTAADDGGSNAALKDASHFWEVGHFATHEVIWH
jgi:hypothetical protein